MIAFEDSNGIILRRQAGDEIEAFHHGDLIHVQTYTPEMLRVARLYVGPADHFRNLGQFNAGTDLEPEGATDYLLAWAPDTGHEPIVGLLKVGEPTHYTYSPDKRWFDQEANNDAA